MIVEIVIFQKAASSKTKKITQTHKTNITKHFTIFTAIVGCHMIKRWLMMKRCTWFNVSTVKTGTTTPISTLNKNARASTTNIYSFAEPASKLVQDLQRLFYNIRSTFMNLLETIWRIKFKFLRLKRNLNKINNLKSHNSKDRKLMMKKWARRLNLHVSNLMLTL